eukprot:TRINITY_DN221_c0_g1_i1.p2 TRINITY_DN221_c0_g1~~TRINITY_DN221_c0_g1_i1.p2  ORF type:complete len:265 (-),score=35.63 TRINITY_DN221_c0_g1_i1:242-1036(-)
MFEATLGQCGVMKKIVEALKELVQEVNFDVNEQGMFLQAMDSSHVSLVCLELKEDGFVNYRCDRPMSMGLNVKNMQVLLRAAEADDKLTMRARDDPDTIEFVFESESQERMMDFEMKLMDIDPEQLGVPDQKYAAQVKLSSAMFTKICRDFGAIGDTMSISVSKAGITFSTCGDIGRANMNLMAGGAPDSDDAVEIMMNEPVSATFGLKFLNTFTKAQPLSERVLLCIAADVPIVVGYNIDQIGSIKYFLAPKLEDANNEDMMD